MGVPTNWVPANGSQSSPPTVEQISNPFTNIAANTLASGTFVRDVDDNAVYLAANDWWKTPGRPALYALSGFVRVRTSTNAVPLTITSNDGIGYVVATGNAHSIGLPPAAENQGRVIRVVAPGAGNQNITIDANAAELINAAQTYVLIVDYQVATLVCDGTKWYANVGDPTP